MKLGNSEGSLLSCSFDSVDLGILLVTGVILDEALAPAESDQRWAVGLAWPRSRNFARHPTRFRPQPH
jgi:hypothetical protein